MQFDFDGGAYEDWVCGCCLGIGWWECDWWAAGCEVRDGDAEEEVVTRDCEGGSEVLFGNYGTLW